MISIVVVLLVASTSLVAYLFGGRRLGLRAKHLRAAGPRVLEGLGVAVIFFAANLAIAIVGVLATRALTGWFVSAYLFNDVTIGILSLVQGLTFHWWWESSTMDSRRANCVAK